MATASPGHRRLGAAVLTLLAVLLALGIVPWGPKEDVICKEASFPDSLLGDYFGHIDGPSATFCVVPTDGAWIAATAVIGGGTGLGLWLGRKSRRAEARRLT